MKGIALLPTKNKNIADICDNCEFKKNCLLAYTVSAYDCEEKTKPTKPKRRKYEENRC